MTTDSYHYLNNRTKIVATVGPACRSTKTLEDLIRLGVDVFRVNTAHGDRQQQSDIIADIRQISQKVRRPIGVLVDLAGPKIRLGQLADDPTHCQDGERFQFIRGTESGVREQLTSTYEPLIDELREGDRVMLADGTVSMRVEEKHGDHVTCKVLGGGTIRSRQGINLPGVALSVPAMTDADRQNAGWAAENGADFVSLSFVRTDREIHDLRELLAAHKGQALVIAKIEKSEALDNLDAIVSASDGVMVARGDLGVEIDVAETPVVQKQIINTCQRFYKPVIVATQMLDSMHKSKRPTRAEVTDVANAIFDGADACMLSGETAIGKYPRAAVEMMNRIMRSAERSLHDMPARPLGDTEKAGVHEVTAAVVYGAGRIAAHAKARLVVIASRSGATARVKSKQRDFIPTIGISDSEVTLRRMSLFWGIMPMPHIPASEGAETRRKLVEWGRQQGLLKPGHRIVFVTGSDLVPNAHNMIVVHEVDE